MNLNKDSSRYWFYPILGLTLTVPLLISDITLSAQPPENQPVTVTNTPLPITVATPLPVTGNVGISGTANVNITNTTLPVTVQNPTTGVTVNNGPTAPVPVENMDNPAYQPFQREIDWTNDPTQMGGSGSFIVPEGKRLVIEQISAQIGLAAGQAWAFSVSTTVNNTTASHRFIVTQSPITSGGDYQIVYYVDRLVRIYADPGTTVTVDVQNTLAGNGRGWSAVSGYLVDVQ